MAVSGWLPMARVEVVNVAVPFTRPPVPSSDVPSKNCTVPPAVGRVDDEPHPVLPTLAEIVTNCPGAEGLGALFSVTVLVANTFWTSCAEAPDPEDGYSTA